MMIYYNTIDIEDINLSKAFNALGKLPEDYVNAYALRSALKNALDDLDKTCDTNRALMRVMKNIDSQIKTPPTDYRGKGNADLENVRQNMESGEAWL
jgi:hypothetical protein